ncbi:hypothetical protein LTR35_005180 [Friedmanniomyces endolithicus]|uniref:Complex 1 LYR protein domain-containing protein n=1 Tax=Friedmanniomyces endolithicus TaxID=329885 RepID=A0AAN6FTN5_9PEZI|nr:hypothetical protein LTR35_005180 [Friedmanniomyces endolithicus]KAK0299615.1 hypothetical protein LTS00_002060 [Friedmanniomyces endolithicus]KAK0323666.1 hypothetical protein LTR82_005413 [Friedmanniomyces endolithicus]KAK1019056.1 hypothetical protein LTR54_000869 [Friedmanniomyces endolithicus]
MSAHTTTNPTTETPSSSETSENPLYPEESVSAADVSTKDSKVGITSNQSSSTTSNQPGSAEAAAEKLYEERIEEDQTQPKYTSPSYSCPQPTKSKIHLTSPPSFVPSPTWKPYEKHMPAHRLPRNSTAHRIAAIALYRALLLSTRTLPPQTFPPPERTSLQNIIRNRFKQARHEQSPRYLRLCFEAGYEALDRLDAAGAVAGDAQDEKREESASYILALLARAPEKVKRAPPLTALDPSLLKDLKLHLRTRPNATATTTETEKPSLFDRPLPLAQLKGGKRRVPVLYNAQGVPVLRLSKPQPAALSGYINHRAEVKQKRHDTRHRLTEELEGARWEDGWDGILERETGVRERNEQGKWRGVGWTQEIVSARDEVGRRLGEDAEKRRVMGGRMQGVVDRERAMAEREGREEAERAFWEASMESA